MAEPFAKLEGVIKGAAGVVALIPGIALFTQAVSLPPPLETFLGGVSLTFGVAVVLAIILFQRRIARAPADRVGVVVLALALAGILTAIVCYKFADTHVMRDREVAIVKPIKPEGKLARNLEVFGGDYAEMLANANVGARARDDMKRQSGSAIWFLSISLLLAQTLLLTAIVLGAWKVAGRRTS